MYKALVIALTLLFSPLAFAGHLEILKNYPNAQGKDWAELAAARAKCLNDLVDWKIAEDIKVGKIRDFGNVREVPDCGAALFEAYNAHRTSKKGR